MKPFVIAYIGALLTYIVLDALWLGVIARGSYLDAMGDLLRDKPYPIWPWIVYYPMYCFVLVYLVIHPSITTGTLGHVAFASALLGLAAYGAYNLTNYAVITDWPLGITFKDWAWGIFVSCASGVSGWLIARHFMH